MKQKGFYTMAIVMAIACTLQANANIWRVNNNAKATNGADYGGTATNPVFPQLKDAVSSPLVVNGDTLQLEGSTIQYNNAAVTKKLAIVGPGYFLLENPNTSNNVLEAKLDYIAFNTGSDGSVLIGVHVAGSYGIEINVSSVIIKRCLIDTYIDVSYDIASITVVQNYFSNYANSSVIRVSAYGFPTDFIFNNNICRGILKLLSGTTIYTAKQVNNNVFDIPTGVSGVPSINLNTSSFQNNILKTAAATVSINGNTSSTIVSYNISASATGQFGTANNNKTVNDMSTLFVAAPGSTDGLYQLKAGSPGSGNGSDATDRGVFGGAAVTNRYTLSGLPNIPVIYNITTTGVATSTGLQVTIKAKTIK